MYNGKGANFSPLLLPKYSYRESKKKENFYSAHQINPCCLKSMFKKRKKPMQQNPYSVTSACTRPSTPLTDSPPAVSQPSSSPVQP